MLKALVADDVWKLVAEHKAFFENDLAVFLHPKEVGHFKKENIVSGDKQNTLFMRVFSAICVQSGQDWEESNLLILHESDICSDDFKEFVDEGDVLAVIFNLTSDINSSGWSRSQKLGISCLKIRFAPVAESDGLNREA